MDPKNLWTRTAVLLATGLGIGFVPVMPGTFGSLWGIVLQWLFVRASLPLGVELFLKVAIVLAGIPICGRAARFFGRTDPGSVVYDEFAAVLLIFLPNAFSLPTAICGFIWFRVFDIAKPWPIRRLERLPGGLGIMIDDVAAAAYASVALWLTVKALAAWYPGLMG